MTQPTPRVPNTIGPMLGGTSVIAPARRPPPQPPSLPLELGLQFRDARLSRPRRCVGLFRRHLERRNLLSCLGDLGTRLIEARAQLGGEGVLGSDLLVLRH